MGETITQPEIALRTRAESRSSRSPTCRAAVGVAPAQVSFAHLVSFPLTRLSFLFCFALPLFLPLSLSLSIYLSLFLSGEAHVPSRPRVATYVRAHTPENGRPFISHPTGERTPTNRTLPRAKTSNRTRPSVQRKRGESARAGWRGARRNEKIVQN